MDHILIVISSNKMLCKIYMFWYVGFKIRVELGWFLGVFLVGLFVCLVLVLVFLLLHHYIFDS